jgi:hypothetical protein
MNERNVSNTSMIALCLASRIYIKAGEAMWSVERIAKSKRIAEWVGVTGGIVLGAMYFFGGMSAFFVARVSDWLGVALLLVMVLACLALLPLSLLGIFKPRIAGYAIVVTFTAYMVDLALTGARDENIKVGMLRVLLFSLLSSIPPFVIAGLFLYASSIWNPRSLATTDGGTTTLDLTSGQDLLRSKRKSSLRESWQLKARPSLANNRRRQAQWAAVIIGTVVGLWCFAWGIFAVSRSIRVHDWVGVVGIGATAVTLLPLSMLSIFKSRTAAYVALVSLVVALLYSVIVFLPGSRVGEAFGGTLWSGLTNVPLMLVTALLFYASGQQPRS